jgi:protein phosphatase 2C family protein 2/3
MAKALNGPALHYASQVCNQKQPPKKPSKKIPEISKAISGDLAPHLHGYSTITHEGIYRKNNEDKVTIFLEGDYKWFSIYDGHGGSACSQFLKDHLHEEFFSLDWRKDTPNALRQAFINAEAKWQKKGDNSGSCALVIFIHDNVCYTANLGDSRAVLAS